MPRDSSAAPKVGANLMIGLGLGSCQARGSFAFATGSLMILHSVGLMLVTKPWISGLGTLNPSAHRKIGQLVQAAIFVDRIGQRACSRAPSAFCLELFCRFDHHCCPS